MVNTIPKVLYKKIFLYIPNKFNIILSNSFGNTDNYEYEDLNINFYQQENLYLINFHKNIFNMVQYDFNKGIKCIMSKLDRIPK